MAFLNEKHDYSIKSKEEVAMNDVEAEAEECLKFINSRDKKESQFTEKLQGLEDNMQELYMKDLAKVYQKSNFSYNPQSKNFSIFSTKDILSQIETNSVVVIKGPTGCGKTTQIPQLILNANMKKRINCNIIVTQPRRIAAINIARRVSQENGWPLGSLVGYKVGMQKEVSSETRLTYCTTEILLMHLIHQKHMFDYTHVILDEIHERDQNLDFILLVIKKLLQTNSRQVKVILMSATISETRFAKYFSSRVGNYLVPAPTIEIKENRTFKICTYYLDEIENLGTIPKVFAKEPKTTDAMINFCSLIIDALDEIDRNDNEEASDLSFTRHAVLIFLPGIYEIQELYSYLSSDYHEDKLWDLLILHSLISGDEQHLIFLKPPKDHRRIILSTNIAESSITVPDVKYVIDFCLVKRLKVDPVTHYESLELSWASKANCEQRAGRTGRVMDGRVYRLVPKAFYDNILNNESTPEILHAPLTNVILRAKILDLDEPRVLLSLSLDPPPLFNLATTIMTLKEVGALVNEDNSFQPYDGKLTDLGRIMAFLPLNIRISKLIMLGHVFGVLRDAIILGASMAVKDIFDMQYYPSVSSYINRRKWARNTDSDCIAILNVYKAWQNEKANRRLSSYQAEIQWAQRNGIQAKVLREIEVMVNEITCRLYGLGITESVGVNKVVWQAMDRDFVLQVILAGAFYPNYFIKRSQNAEDFKDNIARCLGSADPMKTVYLRGWPMDQPGYLYAQKIQKIFSKHQGIPEKQIAVSFDKSTRVYVQFREKKTPVNDENLYNISNFVYQAIKMKRCNVPFKIKLLNAKKADEISKHHDLHKFERKIFFQRGVKKTKNDIFKIRPKLPQLDATFIPLFISTIISPGYFWSILNDDATYEKLQFIERKLNEHPLKKLSIFDISNVIAAPMEKNNSFTYHRAIIEECTSMSEELIDIFFIDHGFSSRLRFSDLREINDVEISKIPCLAFRCSLACLRPSNQINPYGRWSKISKSYFETQVKKSRQIFGKIYSIVDSIINLELIVINDRKEKLNINEDLIEKGYAVRKEENYLSNYNHELRMNIINNISAMSAEEKEFYEEEQYDKDYLLKYPEPPKDKDCDFSVTLYGPHSPLEIDMVQLTLAGRSKKTSVETNSVNSVLLDDLDQSRRLLVAQIVSQGANDHLTLKNTTFLPNIPGLATLLVLCFAPRMELRCNSRKTYYTGALCGLGPMDDCTGQAMFPDHDIEILFDVEIFIDDMNEINKLRYWINKGMQLYDGSNDFNDHIINCQNRLQRILLELRDRQRKLRNLLIDDDDYFSKNWNRYNKSLFLPPAEETTKEYDIYPLHKVLALVEKDEKTEEIFENLSELQRLACEDVQKTRNVTTFCKLCEVETFGLLELRGHLCSEQHKKNEETLLIAKRN